MSQTTARATFAALALGALLGACGKGQGTSDTMSSTTSVRSDTAAVAPSTAPSTTAVAGASGGAPAPITGKTIDVKMVGDAQGYRFEPVNVTIHPGDGVRWTNVSGGPHNVSFWPDSIPAGAQQMLQANMPHTAGPLAGPLLTAPNETYIVSFAGAKPGVYGYYCTPHLALGMKAKITVQ